MVATKKYTELRKYTLFQGNLITIAYFIEWLRIHHPETIQMGDTEANRLLMEYFGINYEKYKVELDEALDQASAKFEEEILSGRSN